MQLFQDVDPFGGNRTPRSRHRLMMALAIDAARALQSMPATRCDQFHPVERQLIQRGEREYPVPKSSSATMMHHPLRRPQPFDGPRAGLQDGLSQRDLQRGGRQPVLDQSATNASATRGLPADARRH